MLDSVYSGGFFCTQHDTGEGHPESGGRYVAVEKALRLGGLKRRDNSLPLRVASYEELELCHGRGYIDLVERECAGVIPGRHSFLSTGDAVICSRSYEVVKVAVGAVLQAVDAVLQGFTKRAFCAVRPPGHHACGDRGMGFCLFNNAAIAARYAQRRYGIERVAILDWDLHHGNGTQEIFYADPTVLYFSTHQGGIYPGTGFAEERGFGEGMGTTYNFPIEGGLRSRLEVIEAFDGPLSKAMEAFRPELIVISAGFDAHVLDPLGGLNLESADYATLTDLVVAIAGRFCQGRLISVLEGGYHLGALAASVQAHVQRLRG